jgi:acetoacetyl-CoA synthetase
VVTGLPHGRDLRPSALGQHRDDLLPAGAGVADIPVTLTGKKMEVPVRRILSGTPPELAANRSAMANPASLDAFAAYARTQPGVPAG